VSVWGIENTPLTEGEQYRLFKALKARHVRVVDRDLLLEKVDVGGLRLEAEGEAEGKMYEAAWREFVNDAAAKARMDEKLAKKLMARSSGSGGSDGSRERSGPVTVAEKDERMARLCAKLLAQDAAGDPVVEAFREREFGEPRRTLSNGEASEYLLQTGELGRETSLKFLADVLGKYLRDNAPRSVPYMLLLDDPGQEAEFADVVDYLAWQYPWEDFDAALFVLTGRVPFVEAVRLGPANDNTFTITVHPWTSKEALDAAYKAIWTPWVGSCQTPRDDALDVMEFVVERINSDGRRPTWKVLQEEWNAQHPDRPYAGDWRWMSRLYRETREKLAPQRLSPSLRYTRR